MAAFESLYPPMGMGEFEAEDEELEIVPLPKRRRLVLTMGPKFRPEHETPFMATNAKIIESEKAGGNENVPLIDFIMDEIAQGVQYHSNLDVMLSDYIHPESPKLISTALKNLDVNGDVDAAMGDVPIPLYLCLIDDQFEQVIGQMGIEDPFNSFFVIQMNKLRNKKFDGAGKKKFESSSLMESFINETVGRFGRYNTKSDSSWDSQQQFFQPIRFKIRIGPRNSVTVAATAGVRRGRGATEVTTTSSTGITTTEYQITQKHPYDTTVSEKKVRGTQEKQFKPYRENSDLQDDEKERTDFLDRVREDGARFAALSEHTFELTTHTLMSPKFRAALRQAGTYIGLKFDSQDNEDRKKSIKALKEGRTHMVTLVEAELKEGETSVSRYTDPRATEDLKKRRIYAAFKLRELLS